MVIPFYRAIQYLYVFQYPQIMEALLDRCLEQVSPCATVPRPVLTFGLQIVRILIASMPGSRQQKWNVNYLQGVRRRGQE